MSLLTKVVVPLDGSKLAEEAIWAIESQLDRTGEIVFVTTIDPAVRRAFGDFAQAENITLYEAVERYLGDMVALMEQRGVRARSRYNSDPDGAEGVLQMVRSEEPSLVVMSSHGRSGLSRLVMGSVASRVLRGASCPTLIVPSS